MEARARHADRGGVRATTARRSFRAREAEVVGALLEEPTAARSRSAAAACSPSACARRSAATSSSGSKSTPRRPGERIARSDRPLARSAEDVAAPAGGAAAALRGAGRRRDPPVAAMAEVARPCRRSGARRAAGGHEDALGRERLRRVPGLRRPRPAWRRPARWPLGGRVLRHRRSVVGGSTRTARRRSRHGSRSSPVRRRRRWPRPSACCASWPGPG